MALKFNTLGYLIEESPEQGDSTTANTYTADMRDNLITPEDGMICFDPDSSGLLFWNGAAWLPVLSSPNTRSVVNIGAGNYIMPIHTDVVVANATDGPVTVQLPSTTPAKGKMYAIIKADATTNPVVVACAGADIIGQGADTQYPLTGQHQSIQVLSTDSGIWYCV